MRKSEVIKHFGSQAKAGAALGITQAAVSKWSEYPPREAQLQLEYLTGLPAEPEVHAWLAELNKYALQSATAHP